VDAEVREKLITARIALLLKAPFFGTLASRLELVNADGWCGTAATDGRKFYYNSEFVNALPQKQIEFLVGHEILHVVYDHMFRRDDRDPRLFNCAADYCVNADLKAQHIGEFIPIGLYDSKYKGMSAEEVYDDLYENAEQIDIDDLMKQLIDEHLDGDGDGDEGEGEGGRPGRMTNEEKKQLQNEIRDAMLQAAETCGADDLPAGVKRIIKELTEPQLNWRELIQQQIQSLIKTDYAWTRPNRKSWHMDAVLPGSDYENTIDVAICGDTSGSMTDEMLHEILSEVKGIMQSYDDFKLKVWTFDTKVYGEEDYSPDNIDDIDEYEMQGGGGTMFECNWEWMKENDYQPKLLIMFTDGYPCGTWGEEDYCDTLFVIHGNTTIEPDFGQHAYYDEAKETT
jgi:predicted metal-dependent peptidase